MTVDARFELDRASHTLILRRALAATPERLFAAWTTPDQVARWWDPEGRPLAECTIDLRVGGGFRFVNDGHPQHPFEGRYTRIDPPDRLMFDAMGAQGTVLFEPEGDRTRMTVSIRCASRDHLEQFVAMGVAEGTAATLDNLAACLGGEPVAAA